MRLAFSTLACPDSSLAESVDAAVRWGYEGIELRIVDGELVTPAMTPEHRRRTKRTIDAAGLTLCCLDTSFEIANPGEPLEVGVACVELAADLDAPLIRVFAGAPAREPWSATVRRTGERAQALTQRGHLAGVAIGVETHDTFAAGAVLAEALEGAPEEVGIIWDTLNPIVVGEPPERTFASVRERLVHMHIKDGAVPPNLDRNQLLGHGRVPVETIVGMLAGAGYDGWLSVEWEKRWQPSIPAADVALPQYGAGLRAILAG
jgi:sugar phosphate isomerase/epimerase